MSLSVTKTDNPLRIFLSYGHDENTELVCKIGKDLQNRGHDVWIDKSDIKAGDDWRRKITDGITNSQRVLSILSKHSIRDEGVCLDEIAIAIGVKGGNIQTILVESEKEVMTPPSISYIQWLDMHDWKDQHAKGENIWNDWYQAKLTEIIAVIESDASRRFAGEIQDLQESLKPISPDSRIMPLLKKKFVGREWVKKSIEEWRKNNRTDRLFWITGDPGVGKSALMADLAHYSRDKVIAIQFCEYDKPDHRNAERIIRSIAFQLATRLPDYRKFLLSLPEIKELDQKNSSELFDYLLANPLDISINGGRERYLVIIDALDEAGNIDNNELVDLLALNASRLPEWIGIIVTSRPEFDVPDSLQGVYPLDIDTKIESNRSDIRDYLNIELAPYLKSRQDANQLVEQILDKSEGVFLYAELFCEEVRNNPSSLDNPTKFPKGLGGIYYLYFKRQFPEVEIYRNEIRPALRAIVASPEPIPTEIIQDLFNWEEEQLNDFVSNLGSIFTVTVERGIEIIKPYHKSLAEWLTDKEKSKIYWISAIEGHKFLAKQGWLKYQQGIEKLSGYELRYLPYHLFKSTKFKEYAEILRDPRFIREKIQKDDMGLQFLIKDYELIEKLPVSIGKTIKEEMNLPLLALICSSLMISANILKKEPTQLMSQITGRLIGNQEKGVQEFLRQMKDTAQEPWLRPIIPSLTSPRGPLVQNLTGHYGKLNAVAISPDGSLAVSGSDDTTIRVWNTETGICKHILKGHKEPVMAVTLTSDCERAVSGSLDSTIKIWDIRNGKEIKTLYGHSKAVNAVAIMPNNQEIISGSDDTTIKIWNLDSYRDPLTLEGSDGGVKSVAVTPDGKRAVSGSENGTIEVWNLDNCQVVRSFPEIHSRWVGTLATTKNGRIVSGSGDSCIKILDLNNKTRPYTLLGRHHRWVNAVAVIDDDHVISGSKDTTIKIWDIKEHSSPFTLRGHNEEITAIAVARDSRRVISGSGDGLIKVWDLERLDSNNTSSGHTRWVKGIAITPDGKYAVSWSGDRTMKVWDIEQGKELHALNEHSDQINSVTFTPDSKCAISGSEDSTLIIWDLDSGEVIRKLEGHKFGVNTIVVTPDGKKVVSGGEDATLRIWNLKTGEEMTLPGHGSGITAIAITADSNMAVSGSKDHTLKVWDLNYGSEILTFSNHEQEIQSVAISTNGEVVSGSKDGSLKVWDVNTGKECITLSEHTNSICAGIFSPNDKKIISLSEDETIKIWDYEKSKVIQTLPIPFETANSVTILPTVSKAIYGTKDNALKIWDLKTGIILAEFYGDGPILASGYSESLDSIIAGDKDGHIHILRLEMMPTINLAN